MITDTTVPRMMRNVVLATTYIPFWVLYNQLTNFGNDSNNIIWYLIVWEITNVVYTIYFIFSYIPNVLLIITEILAYIAQFPKRIDALIVDIYMNVIKEFWLMPVRYETKSLENRMILNYYWQWQNCSIAFLSWLGLNFLNSAWYSLGIRIYICHPFVTI